MGDSSNESGLFALFFVFFVIVFLTGSFCIGGSGICSFVDHCKLGCCCCVLDAEAYQRERQSLRRLREMRRMHRLQDMRTNDESFTLATFSQIPGAIPDASGTRNEGRVPRIGQAHRGNTHSTSPGAYGTLGFILVPAGTTMPHTGHGSTGQPNSFHVRNQLPPNQRRAILEHLLACKTYQIDTNDGIIAVDQDPLKGGEESVKDLELAENPAPQLETPPAHNFVFPFHEQPDVASQTCAICLDDFVHGEKINETHKCLHVFHKTCLLEWLDEHNVCPCCRCPMITDSDWQRAALDLQLITEESTVSISASAIPTTTATSTVAPS